MKYSQEQKDRVKEIVNHHWCLKGHLFVKGNNDYLTQQYLDSKTRMGLFDEINNMYLGDKNLGLLYKALDILGLLEEYKTVGHPNFRAFRDWFHEKTNNLNNEG